MNILWRQDATALLFTVLTCLGLVACSAEQREVPDGDGDADADADGDADGDADADGDGDADGDADGDGDADADADGDADGDADADGDVDDPCLRGDSSGAQGDPCACGRDCSETAQLCTLADATGDRYCAATGCLVAGAPPCDGDSLCVGVAGVPALSYCMQCIGPGGDTGAACRCDSDCADVIVGSRTRQQACIENVCAVSPCGFLSPCPEGTECQNSGGDFYCQECLAPPTPATHGEACSCQSDCEAGLTCDDDVCAITECDPADASDCPTGYECRTLLSGRTRCEPESLMCDGGGTVEMGGVCHCDADCAPEAPVCVRANVSGFDVDTCTLVPCDRRDPDPCPPGLFDEPSVCCWIPGVIGEPTCMSSTLMDLMGLSAFCTP